jgi:hypothetical protein
MRTAAAAFVAFGTVACLGSASGPPLNDDDVAVVGQTHITKAQYSTLLARAERVTSQAYSPLPESPSALSSAVMARLVSDAQQRNSALARHTTEAALRERVEARARVTAAVRDTFVGFMFEPRRAREVRVIMLYDRPVAQTLFAQLSVGSDAAWCRLAMRSIERAPAYRCGAVLVTNGELEQPLGRLVFSLPEDTPTLVRTHDGYWTILEAVSLIYRGGTPGQVDDLLLTQSKTVRLGRWEATLNRGYCTGKNVAYRHGYRPDPDPTACA